MKLFKISLLAIACIFCNNVFSQQIRVTSDLTPQQLIEDKLIQGCVEISNIASPVNGAVNNLPSYGYFEKGNSDFPFKNGLVLSTGNVNSAGNKIKQGTLNEGETNWTSDQDLENALGISNTLNATAIEFDFSSLSNQIQFNYLLASEEYYANFPCEYSDGFAFLIKRADTNEPYTNIALVPGTEIPVNTNTIHNEIVGFCDAANPEYFEGYALGATNYNGRTKVMTATAKVIPNVKYHIKLVIADQTDKNYDSAVFIEGNSFSAVVDLGEDITTCADHVILDGNIDNLDGLYSWYLNGKLLEGEKEAVLETKASGKYSVKVDIPIAGTFCTITDDVLVTLSSTQPAAPISEFGLCDDISGDGKEIFDLTFKNKEVLKAVRKSEYDISYHFTEEDANINRNSINKPVENVSARQTIFVRIEDKINGCLAYSSFDIVVYANPDIATPTDLSVCDDITSDGITTIDLSQKNDEITKGQKNLVVSYFRTQKDAEDKVNAIVLPYKNLTQSEQLFVRVENSNTGCTSFTTLNVFVLDNPAISYEGLFINSCDPEHDGFSNFNLNDISAKVLNGLSGMIYTFHITNEDALSGSNPIQDPENYRNTKKDFQTLYIRVGNEVSGCTSVAPFEIHTNLLLTGTKIKDFAGCDSKDNTLNTFDLKTITKSIINKLPNIKIKFYESLADQARKVNALNPDLPYHPPHFPMVIYITLDNGNCSEESKINLTLNPVIDFPSIGSVNYCDNDQDGFTAIDLSSFSEDVANGEKGYTVRYYKSEADANKNTKALPNIYTNISNPQTIYTRTTSKATGCSDIKSFTINILPAPETKTPQKIVVCDDDQDGFYEVDLSTTIKELVSNTTNRKITFHKTKGDANSATAAILNIYNYKSNTQTLYARVENNSTGCHSVEPIEIIVNTLPVFPSISNFNYCETDSDGIGEFIFSTKDSEILNGQKGKVASYYLTQKDADNRTNALNKKVGYVNISNPQTIFVRVENTSNKECYGTSSFPIEVGTSPEFNLVGDWFVCDDISNDSREIFDLSEKRAEIIAGINDQLRVSFYTSRSNAENGTNAIDDVYKNIKNPQRIFARVENASICASITSFNLGVIKAPEANPSKPLVQCDTDYDGIMTFNLKQSEFDILDVRQNHLVIAYYETPEDLAEQINPIVAPEKYTNTSNPQTVYVRLTNSISKCYLSIPLELVVNTPPAFNPISEVISCDSQTHIYDLSTIDNLLMDDVSDYRITYHSTSSDALSGDKPLNNNYNYKSFSNTIYSRIENIKTGCVSNHQFHLSINPLPIAGKATNLESCDDDFDGLFTFDLSQQTPLILGSQNQSYFKVSYYNNAQAAENGHAELPMHYAALDQEVIYARIENKNTGCFDISTFKTLVHQRPVVDISDQVICLNSMPLIVSADTNNSKDTYIWSTNQTTPEIEISEVGTYWVTVTSGFGCETTQEFNVIESESATIEVTETVDFSDPNNITVTISGIGDYMYILDDNKPQESNVFQNVPIGYHQVTIIDLNGCARVSKEVIVIDTPKFMTPNNDGYFDTWHITGVSTLPGTVVHIYDRYGKEMARLTANSRGWDGTHNGHNMPATDYWFVADIIKDNISFQLKGHFALRR